jgi:hypothetical protein
VLSRIFGPKRVKLTKLCRKVQNEALLNVNSAPNTINGRFILVLGYESRYEDIGLQSN